MTERTLAWHFLQPSGCLRFPPHTKVEVGQTLDYDGPVELCKTGLHASIRAIDALEYAPGPICCRVKVWGDVYLGMDKIVGRHRRVIAMADVTRTLQLFACGEAERALALLDQSDPRSAEAIRTKRRWLDSDASDAELAAARDAAWAAARTAAGDAARDAAWAAARNTAGNTAGDTAGDTAWDEARAAAWAAARTAAWDAAREAAWDTAWETAWDAARAAQNARLEAALTAALESSGVPDGSPPPADALAEMILAILRGKPPMRGGSLSAELHSRGFQGSIRTVYTELRQLTATGRVIEHRHGKTAKRWSLP